MYHWSLSESEELDPSKTYLEPAADDVAGQRVKEAAIRKKLNVRHSGTRQILF